MLPPAEPMDFHGPGWNVEDADGTLYQLWAPNDKRPDWMAAWTSADGKDCTFLVGDTPAQVLTCLPDDGPARNARAALMAAASQHNEV